jgi:CO/xanthine dehydrogenase FAD-binding subunit
MQGCYAVHPSDTAAALIALDAQVKTTKRTVSAEEFFTVDVMKTTVLDYDEIVSEVVMPRPKGKSSYIKFALRESIDFPIVSCAAMVALSGRKVDRARICLNAVYLKPYRANKGEEAVLGKALNEANAKAAGEATVEDAQPMGHNRYMVPVARTMIMRALLACK